MSITEKLDMAIKLNEKGRKDGEKFSPSFVLIKARRAAKWDPWALPARNGWSSRKATRSQSSS